MTAEHADVLLQATLVRQQACIDELVARLEQYHAERADLLQRTLAAESTKSQALRDAAQLQRVVKREAAEILYEVESLRYYLQQGRGGAKKTPVQEERDAEALGAIETAIRKMKVLSNGVATPSILEEELRSVAAPVSAQCRAPAPSSASSGHAGEQARTDGALPIMTKGDLAWRTEARRSHHAQSPPPLQSRECASLERYSEAWSHPRNPDKLGSPALSHAAAPAVSAQYPTSAHSTPAGQEFRAMRLEFGSQRSHPTSMGRPEGVPAEKVYGRARRRETVTGAGVFSGFMQRRPAAAWNPYQQDGTDAAQGQSSPLPNGSKASPHDVLSEMRETVVQAQCQKQKITIPPLWGPDMPAWAEQEVPPYLRDDTIDGDLED